MTDTPPVPPLYQRLYSVLRQRIGQGHYPPDAALPGELELAEEFAVSRSTVRLALAELARGGLVARRRGVGTFPVPAAEPGPAVVRGTFAELLDETPSLPIADTSVEPDAPVPYAVARRLGLPGPVGTAVHTRRSSGGEIFVYSVHYLAPGLEDVVASRLAEGGGMVSALVAGGVGVQGGTVSVTAGLADAEVARRLEIELGAPVLCAERDLSGPTGTVEVLRSWYRGDRFAWTANVEVAGEGRRSHVRLRP